MVSVTEVVYTTSSTTSTSSSTVYSSELPRVGCGLTDTASSTTATSTAACSASQYPAPSDHPVNQGRPGTEVKRSISGHNTTTRFTKRVPCGIFQYPYLLLPEDPLDVAILDSMILGYSYEDANGNYQRIPYTKIWAPSHRFTGGWFFEFMTDELVAQLKVPPLSDKVRQALSEPGD